MLCKPCQSSDGNHKCAVCTVYAAPFWILWIHCSTLNTADDVLLRARGWWFCSKEKCHRLNNSAVFLLPPFESLHSPWCAGAPSWLSKWCRSWFPGGRVLHTLRALLGGFAWTAYPAVCLYLLRWIHLSPVFRGPQLKTAQHYWESEIDPTETALWFTILSQASDLWPGTLSRWWAGTSCSSQSPIHTTLRGSIDFSACTAGLEVPEGRLHAFPASMLLGSVGLLS